jgi:hypothetical protein
MLENTEKQSKIKNPEKLATKETQDEEKQSKNTTHYVLDTTTIVFSVGRFSVIIQLQYCIF